jgi:uncharacterized protein
LKELNTNLPSILAIAEDKVEENEAFRRYLELQDADLIDAIVLTLNDEIAPQIDCTQCGNCCKSLMINVTENEATNVAAALQQPIETFKANYIEESLQGKLIINMVPCVFLNQNKCTIYQNRFNECREFPHLHKPQFVKRLFGILYSYQICPITFNVIESLKAKVNFMVTE